MSENAARLERAGRLPHLCVRLRTSTSPFSLLSLAASHCPTLTTNRSGERQCATHAVGTQENRGWCNSRRCSAARRLHDSVHTHAHTQTDTQAHIRWSVPQRSKTSLWCTTHKQNHHHQDLLTRRTTPTISSEYAKSDTHKVERSTCQGRTDEHPRLDYTTHTHARTRTRAQTNTVSRRSNTQKERAAAGGGGGGGCTHLVASSEHHLSWPVAHTHPPTRIINRRRASRTHTRD